MRILRENLWLPLVLFLAMLVDGQIATALANLLPLNWHLVSHLLLILMLFTSIELADLTNFSVFVIIGFLYDAYYFHVIGIATMIMPLLTLLVLKLNTIMMSNRWTRLLAVLVLVFLFELSSFLLASFLQLVNMDLGLFIVYSLAPSMLFNGGLLLFLQPLLEKIYL
ncbi:rod shape-determining protein MreD [Streptococcus oricebi]|uniref:Rod shape-determining protein MreD n=1 Tax=Streptococcus oricebi TaxID=1547447 RepID=A0ABS5B624_9STRE|nr:rod shape-determining protein MreD [Streptococcus oricebi]MBP2624265.1 rod shape-determining protein MreD [Streptococcus oricebi]